MHNRLLVVLEDYSEMVFWETILKKLGWDVVAMQSEISLMQKLLVLNPDFIICNAMGTKVTGSRIIAKIRFRGEFPKLIYFKNQQQNISKDPQNHVHEVLDRPVKPRQLLQVLSDAGGLNLEISLQKLAKLQNVRKKKSFGQDAAESSPILKSKDENIIRITSKNKNPKTSHYAEITRSLPKQTAKTLAPKIVEQQVQQMRAEEDTDEVREIDEQRKEFVKALYKK